MRICIIDNYDSFTYNLVQIIERFPSFSYTIIKNDSFDIEELNVFIKILFSPGPGIPSQAGKMNEVIKKYHSSKSLLGICLGHQAIAEVFGGTIYNLPKPLHGIKENIFITDTTDYLFDGLPSEIEGGLYHSWAVEEKKMPSALKVIAKSKSGIVMGVSHYDYDVKGLQFHPESIMTPYGEKIIENWLKH